MEEHNHRQKMVAPIVITVLIVLYEIIYFGLIMWLIPLVWLKVIFAVIPLVLGVLMIRVCTERIKEIKDGVEDDLSNY